MNIELNKAVVHFKMKFPETRIVKGILTDLFPEEAVKWLRKAAELGNQEAMLKLGTLLFNDKRSFSDIISDYEAIIHKHSEEINQWKTAYNTANNAIKENEAKYHQQLSIVSEQEYTAGYNDVKAGKRNKYTKEEPNIPANPAYDFGNVKVGSVIKFGNYPQNRKDKKEPIEWRVLAVEDGRALLISQYGLDCKRYHESRLGTSWEECTLREWLNDDFLCSAFDDVEQELICLSMVTADKNPKYYTPQGNDTEDKVFLLSIKEAEKYFKSDKDRQCIPTEFALKNGVYKNDDGMCYWWLRTVGFGNHKFFLVNTAGAVSYGSDYADYDGRDLYNDINSVRPALWINLKS